MSFVEGAVDFADGTSAEVNPATVMDSLFDSPRREPSRIRVRAFRIAPLVAGAPGVAADGVSGRDGFERTRLKSGSVGSAPRFDIHDASVTR